MAAEHLAHYRESHPLPFVITHYVNLVAMVLLIISGFYIHYPFVGGLESMCRGVHIFCGFVLLINCIVRVILAFCIKSAAYGGTRITEKDVHSWLPQAQGRHQLVPQIKYYLGMRKDHPLTGKYNALQKIAYLIIPLLILFMFFTGLALWGTTSGTPLGLAVTNFFGGAMGVRIAHYYGMWVFIVFIIIHVYMVILDGKSTFMIMFARKEHGGLVYDPNTQKITGTDDLH